MTSGIRGRNPYIYKLTRIAARICLFPFFQIHTHGLKNIPVKESFILLPKHQRWEDIPLLSLASPRPLYYLAKKELFLNPLSGWIISSLGGVPLNRVRPMESRGSLRMMMEFFRRGEGVVVFPEGTYYRGRMGPGRIGLIRMIASRIDLTFIPVGVRYSGRGGRMSVDIVFGTPIYRDFSEDVNVAFEFIMQKIRRLSGL